LQSAGFSPAGAKIFEIKGNEAGVETYYFIPMENALKNPESIARELLTDLLRIFPAQYGSNKAFDGKKHVISRDEKNNVEYIFAGREIKLIKAIGNGWETGYYKYDGTFPVNFVYDRTAFNGYRLIFRINTVIWK
jgi:hypothetical protein